MTETAAPFYRRTWAELGLDLQLHDVLLRTALSANDTGGVKTGSEA